MTSGKVVETNFKSRELHFRYCTDFTFSITNLEKFTQLKIVKLNQNTKFVCKHQVASSTNMEWTLGTAVQYLGYLQHLPYDGQLQDTYNISSQ